jgi:hypothetical protein
MTWIEVSSQADLDELMDTFGSFHDGCLKEMRLWTETFVQPSLSMSVGLGWDHHARFLFQRQWATPSAIEIQFDEIRGINVAPAPPNYDSSIFGATLLLLDSVFYWAEVGIWKPDDPDCNDVTWVAAGRMKWRDASEWMGETMRYGPQAEIANNG